MDSLTDAEQQVGFEEGVVALCLPCSSAHHTGSGTPVHILRQADRAVSNQWY